MVTILDIPISFTALLGSVLGIATLKLWFGKKVMDVDFQVIDIPISFTALLGRPWIHQINGVASTLHQYVKFQSSDGTITTIYGDSVTVEGTSTGGIPILETLQESGFLATVVEPW